MERTYWIDPIEKISDFECNCSIASINRYRVYHLFLLEDDGATKENKANLLATLF